MYYGYTTLGTGWEPPDWRIKLLGAVLFFLPRANPDYDRLFPQVRRWCLELDDNGVVTREIALDSAGSPIFRIPDGTKNRGFWMDEDRQFSREELELVSKEEFERLWGA